MIIELLVGLSINFLYGTAILSLLGYDPKDLFKRPYLLFCFGTGGTALSLFFQALLGFGLRSSNNLIVLVALLLLCAIKRFIKALNRKSWAIFSGPWSDSICRAYRRARR